MAISEKSDNSNQPAIQGYNTAGGDGVFGKGRRGVVGVSDDFQGVYGKSRDNAGVVGESDRMHAVFGVTHSTFAGVYGASDAGGTGVAGECKSGRGVHGVSETGSGVVGESKTGRGVHGISETWQGIYGHSRDNAGVVGESDRMHAVFGVTHSTFAGVYGASDAGGAGVAGECKSGRGVHGISETGTGVNGESESGIGIHGIGKHLAGLFEGDVEVTGDIRLRNADFAEDFTILDVATAEPGTVMVINDDSILQPSEQAYDRRVAGVISGAGEYKPAIVLDKQHSVDNRLPIALVGKVYCKVDAQYGAIKVGDLLTTSPTSGHAMKVIDPQKAFGAVIGKALRSLQEGQGLIPILIALQ